MNLHLRHQVAVIGVKYSVELKNFVFERLFSEPFWRDSALSQKLDPKCPTPTATKKTRRLGLSFGDRFVGWRHLEGRRTARVGGSLCAPKKHRRFLATQSRNPASQHLLQVTVAKLLWNPNRNIMH